MNNSQSQVKNAWLIYAGALMYLFLRTPRALIHGYLYAEEGTVYLRYAWDAPVLHALLAPHQSYYSLYANVCGVLAARAFPLEWAGFFLAWSGLAIQLLLVYLLVQCERFVGFKEKALAVAVCLLTVPTMSVVLSTINAQFFLAIATAIILISDAERLKSLRAAIILFAGFNGVTSCILLPFFLLRTWMERTRARLVQAALLSVATLTQALVVLHMARVQARTLVPHSALKFMAGAFLVNGPLSQFFTRWTGNMECRVMTSPKFLHWEGARWFATETAAFVGMAVLLFLL
jgi:hypothetical protein